jgi:hypothetical protein
MAKWDFEKLDKAIKKAEKDNEEPPVPVPAAPKLTREETLRRYDKG